MVKIQTYFRFVLQVVAIIQFSRIQKVSSSSCQVYPSEYAYHDDSVTRAESASANCRRYPPGTLPGSLHPERYIHCDGTQFKLTDSNLGQEQYQSSEYYQWSGGSDGQLLFIFPTRVSLTTITLHYYSDSVRGRPRLRFYAVPDDFDIWDAPTTGTQYRGVASVPPGGEPAGRRSIRINTNFNTRKVLMYKYSSSFQLAMSEVEFLLGCTESVTPESTIIVATERPTLPSIPPPMVKIVSSMADPVPSGSSLHVTCIIEWMMPVPRPTNIQVVWTGPNQSSLTSDLVKEAPSRYTSEVELDSIDSTYEGEYTCTVNIGKETNISAKKTLTVGDAMFQIRLKRIGDCQLWTATKASHFRRHIEEALIEAVEIRCKCHFPRSHLLNGTFLCQSSSTHATYRNTLLETYNFNATQLLGFIQDWVSSAASVKMDWYSVAIDKRCSVAIASLNERECGHEMMYGDPWYHRARCAPDFDMLPRFDTCNCPP